MTTTILKDEQIESIAQQYTVTAPNGNVVTTGPWQFARAIEKAVLQSEQVQSWKKDAQRYRWLRQHPLDGLEETTPCIRAADDDPGHWALNGEAADAAIDAAMEKQK